MADNPQSLFLSASDIKDMVNWPDALVNDYISRTSSYMLIGSGSPEGVQPSNLTRQYLDKDTSQLYVNPRVGSRTGWVLV